MSSFSEYQDNHIIKASKKENESKADINNDQQKYSILSFLKSYKNENQENLRSNSNSYNSIKKYCYDSFPTKKFDENNTSFSNISFFDLEYQEEDDFNSSFNSLENSFEENYEKNEETSNNLKIQNVLDEVKYRLNLDKEYEEIEKDILNIKN